MNIITTVNADLSSRSVTEDGTLECTLPNYNPETLQPFRSRDEVEAYARTVVGRPHFWGPAIPVVPVGAPKVSPIQFKLLFTGPERVAINAVKGEDELLADFFEILDDPRLDFVDLGLTSTQEGVAYVASKGLIEPHRVAEILSGQFR